MIRGKASFRATVGAMFTVRSPAGRSAVSACALVTALVPLLAGAPPAPRAVPSAPATATGRSVTAAGRSATTAGTAATTAGFAATTAGTAAVAEGTDTGGRAWPVGSRPAVLRGWLPPDSPYGPGHRGVDLAAGAGAPVRAAAAGRVSFAGRVAGRGVLSITLTGTGDPPLRTTYEPVEPLAAKGDLVTAGQPVATLAAGPFHCPTGCLHWGLLRGAAYLNPLSLLPPWLLRRGPSRLLPVFGVPEPAAGEPPSGSSEGGRSAALLPPAR